MTHEFRTTPSKLDCALPTLHPKHSNAGGEMISVRDRVRVRIRHEWLDSIRVWVDEGSGSG